MAKQKPQEFCDVCKTTIGNFEQTKIQGIILNICVFPTPCLRRLKAKEMAEVRGKGGH